MNAGAPHEGRVAAHGMSGGEPAILRIKLLGGFGVAAGDVELPATAWTSRKAGLLVKLLALAPGHALHREEICDRLWPEFAPAAANNLRQMLHVARGRLRALPLEADQILRTQGERVHLYPAERVRTDVAIFEAAAVAARHAAEPGAYWAAIEMYAGPLLPDDPYEDWTAARRESLAAAYLALLDDVAQLHEVRGEFPLAVAALERLVTTQPTDEAATVRLMRLYTASGRRPAALRHYARLVQELARELDVAPEPATQELYQAIKLGRFPPHTQFDDARPIPSTNALFKVQQPTNLPHALGGFTGTSFVGRDVDAEKLSRLIIEQRLVTLTGAGGSGKTRLALEVARTLASQFPDGAWVVELAALQDPSLTVAALAAVLGVREEGARSLDDLVVARLRRGRVLLIFDNCEHLVRACAALAQRLLADCPDLHLLATSRARLGLAGELVWPVAPLPTPKPEDLARLDQLAAVPSVRLFVERARLNRPSFALTPALAPAVAAICQRLDGLPLAIELAAARTNVLAPAEIAARLDDSLHLLVARHESLPERHRALRGTLEWSERLLTPAEQLLFRRLAVFRGGCTLEAAAAVCGGDGIASGQVLDLLAGLVDESLVLVEDSDLASRYHLLEPVRQYAWDRLAACGDLIAARDRHAAYYLALAESAESPLLGSEQAIWLERLEREHDNVRTALAWLRERGDIAGGLRLAGALWWFWYLRSHFTQGIATLLAYLECDETVDPALRAKALLGAGALAFRAGSLTRARDLLEESVAIHRAIGDAGARDGRSPSSGTLWARWATTSWDSPARRRRSPSSARWASGRGWPAR